MKSTAPTTWWNILSLFPFAHSFDPVVGSFTMRAHIQIAAVSQNHLFHIFSLRNTHSYIIIRETKDETTAFISLNTEPKRVVCARKQ